MHTVIVGRRANWSSMMLGATVVLFLAACAAAPPARPTIQRNASWVAARTNQPEADVDRECVRGALQIAFALLAFKDGGVDDKYIQTALLEQLPTEQVRTLRKADYAEWQKTHEPSSVATTHLSLCLANNGNGLPVTEQFLRCFFSTEPAALMSIYRRLGRSLAMAVQAVTPYYPINADASEIAELGRQVFELPTDAHDLQFRENMFSDCLLLGAG